jgi:polar amino acid transport system substrate-binding protein
VGGAGALVLVLALGAACGNGGGGAGPSAGLEHLRSTGELRWGADRQGGEPYVYEDPAHPDQLIGFEVDLAAALARELGVRPRFVQNDWSTLVPSLERGTFDIALNGLEVTPARAGRIAFTRPYFLFSERLVTRADDAQAAADLAGLRGHRVGTLANSQAWDLLLAAGAQPVPYEGADEPFLDLERGRTDAVLLDDIIVDRYAPRHPALRMAGDLAEGQYAIGVRRGERALLEAVDDALERIIARGELKQILGRYQLWGPWQVRLAAMRVVDNPGTGAPGPGAPASAGATPTEFGPRPLDRHQLVLFLQAALATLVISTAAMVLAIPLGVLLALARLYLPRLRPLATIYVEVVRGTPVLLQLYLLYYGLARVLSLDAWLAAILGLGLNYAAYEAEIYRAGLGAVPAGQLEAALALGMPRRLALRRIVMPQAFRVALPGMTNDFIALLKDSALVSVITVVELTKRMTITAVDLRGWLAPGLLCAAFYLAMSYPLSRLARQLERRLGGTT